MESTTLALLVQEAGRIVTAVVRSGAFNRKSPTPKLDISQEIIEEVSTPTETGEKARSVESGCVPCAIGHLGTCSELLNESMRFANKDGMTGEVIDRINMCLDQLNGMERVDLRPEMISELPEWEKDLAKQALVASRATRHGLEAITTVKDLEKLAASTQTTRNDIGREWFRHKLSLMSNADRQQLKKNIKQHIEKEQGEEASFTDVAEQT